MITQGFEDFAMATTTHAGNKVREFSEIPVSS